MKLYMKQKVFSWVDKFTVKDENGQDKYNIEGELFSFGKKLHIYNAIGTETAFIQQKVFSFLPRHFVFVDGSQVAEINKEFTFLCPKYSIEGLGWDITINNSADFIRTAWNRKEGIYSPVTQCKRHLELIKQIRSNGRAETNYLGHSDCR